VTLRDVLRIRDFRRLWAAQAVSDVGDGLTSLTLLLVAVTLTGSTAAVAAMAMALAIPAIVVGPIAGVFVDRWDRRRVMLAADLLRALIVLGFIAVRSADQLPLLYALAIAHASVGTFFAPARMALVPHIVQAEGLMAANSLAQITRVIAAVIGSSLAGIFMGVAEVSWPAFVADSATFLLSFLLVLGVRTSGRIEGGPPHEAGARGVGGVGRSLREGLVLVARSRILLGTMIGATVTMLGLGAVNVLFVPLFVTDLHLPIALLGALEIAQTTSMILAAGIVGVLAARLRPTRIVVGGLAGIAVVVGLLGGVRELWQLAVLLFAVGWFVTPLEAALATILQTSTEDAQRGRVAATLHALMSAASVTSMALAGVFGDVVGVRNAFFLGGAVVGVAALAAWLCFRGAASATGQAPSMTGERSMVRT
jgi:MFS family permease